MSGPRGQTAFYNPLDPYLSAPTLNVWAAVRDCIAWSRLPSYERPLAAELCAAHHAKRAADTMKAVA